MTVKRIRVENFRNIKAAELEFCDGINIFFGNNAQGKTNMLEALSVCLGRSFRNVRSHSFIPFENENNNTSITLYYSPDDYPEKENIISYKIINGRAEVDLNGFSLKNAAELYGELKYVVFIPEHLSLVKGAPELRRYYLDNAAVMQSKSHKRVMNDYKEALKHHTALRNELFLYPQSFYAQDMLAVWDDILVKQGINLTYGRLKFFGLIKEYANALYGEISGGAEKLDMFYKSDIFGDIDQAQPDFTKRDELYGIYMEKLLRTGEKSEFKTYAGAHRDDLFFSINGANAREYGSQGQLRSISLALKLSEAEIIRSHNKEKPVILLDEVLGELDGARRSFITKRFENTQAFLTSCDYRDFEEAEKLNVFRVEKGEFYPLGR